VFGFGRAFGVEGLAMATYDRIGVDYHGVRHADPRLAALIHGALDGARTVANVGAGAGSYEPANMNVTAVGTHADAAEWDAVVAGDGQHVAQAESLDTGAERGIVAVDLITGDPPGRHAGCDRAGFPRPSTRSSGRTTPATRALNQHLVQQSDDHGCRPSRAIGHRVRRDGR
jgi:hypothetical protein